MKEIILGNEFNRFNKSLPNEVRESFLNEAYDLLNPKTMKNLSDDQINKKNQLNKIRTWIRRKGLVNPEIMNYPTKWSNEDKEMYQLIYKEKINKWMN